MASFNRVGREERDLCAEYSRGTQVLSSSSVLHIVLPQGPGPACWVKTVLNVAKTAPCSSVSLNVSNAPPMGPGRLIVAELLNVNSNDDERG